MRHDISNVPATAQGCSPSVMCGAFVPSSRAIRAVLIPTNRGYREWTVQIEGRTLGPTRTPMAMAWAAYRGVPIAFYMDGDDAPFSVSERPAA